jgi:5-(carboxyamino)imidazole ribonucleotide synthase
VGDHTDLEAVHAFAEHCDVVTFDHEHVPPTSWPLLVAEGVPCIPPGCAAFRAGQARDA